MSKNNTNKNNRPSRLELARSMMEKGEGNPFERRGRKVVDVGKLVEDPRNERKTFRNMDGLVASVKAMGLVEPPTVIPIDGDAYMLTTGHRRYRAAKLAGLTQIEVLVRDPEAELVRRRKSVVSNVQREDVNPMELAEGLQSLLDEDEEINSQRELAHAIGKGESWVSEMLSLLRLPGELQAKLRAAGEVVQYDVATKIAREKDVDFQAELVGDVLAGATSRDVRDKINERRNPRPPAGQQSGTESTASSAAGAAEAPATKPKIKLPTHQRADVIIQSRTTETLSPERQVKALQEALELAQARLRDAQANDDVPPEQDRIAA